MNAIERLNKGHITVIKRDGKRVPFNAGKILAAVTNAYVATNYDGDYDHNKNLPLWVTKLTCERLEKNANVTVEEIQDTVEKVFMSVSPNAAKAYILYRQKRTEARTAKSSIMKGIESLVKEMNNDNANTQNSAASKMYGIAESVSKPYFLSKMSPKHAENHQKGRIYIHDLGYYGLTWNCFFNPLGEMLKKGFDNGVGYIRPPKRIGSAVALACIILQSSQNDMFGGQGFLNFDTDLAPYVDKEREWQLRNGAKDVEEATEKAVYQAMEAFVYNMNTMRSRSGAQVTFSSVNFGTDTSEDARMISRNLFKAYMAGLGNGENPIFPNLCYRLKDGINLHEGEPNFDITELAIECVGKRIQPRFVFADSNAYHGLELADIGTMGCRTAVRGNVNADKRHHGSDARGNLFFNTISLPYLALEARREYQEGKETDLRYAFNKILFRAVTDAIWELLERYEVVKNFRVKDIPFVGQWYMGHEGLNPDDTVENMVKHGSLAVGFVGLAECLQVLTGHHHGESKDAQEIGQEIIREIRWRTDAATEKHGLNFSTFAAPAESACYTLLKKAREEFGIVKNVTDKEYFTNSTHLPVSFECDMKKKIDIEAPYHLLCNGGHIFYIETGSSPKWNPEGVLKTLQYIAKSGIVYGGLNWQHNFCNACGWQGSGHEPTCPKCGSKDIKITRIITGYLSTTDHFNAGKLAESSDRKAHA